MNPNTRITKKGRELYHQIQPYIITYDYDSYTVMQICSLLMRHGNTYFHISEMQCNSPDISYQTYKNNPDLANWIEIHYTEYWDKRDTQISKRITDLVTLLAKITHLDFTIEWNMGITLRHGNSIFYLVD